ncbi:hypothetical protein C0J52_26213 [Blattella germanica]|nr:hypothetical protein C0J52_26213 [Blattella germanica]
MEMGRPCHTAKGQQMDIQDHSVGPRIGKRTQGRPRRRWADIFKEHAGRQWSRLAGNRKKWKCLEYQLCSECAVNK